MPINSIKGQGDRIAQSANTGQGRPAIIRDAPRRVIIKPFETKSTATTTNPFSRKKYGKPAEIKRDSTEASNQKITS
jgi:hypothetical protein